MNFENNSELLMMKLKREKRKLEKKKMEKVYLKQSWEQKENE